jgi:hypothetical protein
MKCPVCGAIEGQGECTECVALAQEMQANDEVFEMLRDEPLPPLVIRMPRRLSVYVWVAAAAAVLVIVAVPILRNRTEVPKPVVVAESQRSASEPLTVRIVTPDPDVVILWQIDLEGGASR